MCIKIKDFKNNLDLLNKKLSPNIYSVFKFPM